MSVQSIQLRTKKAENIDKAMENGSVFHGFSLKVLLIKLSLRLNNDLVLSRDEPYSIGAVVNTYKLYTFAI